MITSPIGAEPDQIIWETEADRQIDVDEFWLVLAECFFGVSLLENDATLPNPVRLENGGPAFTLDMSEALEDHTPAAACAFCRHRKNVCERSDHNGKD